VRTEDSGAVAVTGCAACEHPARAEIDQQLVHDVATELVAQSFGISETLIAWHRDQHVSSTALRREVRDPQALLLDLDYGRSRVEALARSAASAGQRVAELSAWKEYREFVTAICKLTSAREALAKRQPENVPTWQEVCDALWLVIDRHPDWKDALVEAFDTALKKTRVRNAANR
jgi:hypothetical protein